MDEIKITQIVDMVMSFEEDKVRSVEKSKHEIDFDVELSKEIILAGPTLNERQVAHNVEIIRRYYNVIVIFVALCETRGDVLRAELLNRIPRKIRNPRYKKNFPDHINSHIKEVMKQVDGELGFSEQGVNDKKLTRTKVKHASRLLAQLLRDYSTDEKLIPWPGCDFD